MDASEQEFADAARGLRAVLGMAVRSLGPVLEDLSGPQLRVLALLVNTDAMQVGDIAPLLDLSPSAATRFAARLEDRGLIERRRSSTDRRAVTMHLTPKGEDLVGSIRTRRDAGLKDALAGMDEDLRRRALDGLRAWAEALHEPDDTAALLALAIAPGDAPRPRGTRTWARSDATT